MNGNGQIQESQTMEQTGFQPTFNDPSSMQIRLDTESVKIKLSYFLKGYYEDIEVKPDGSATKKLRQLGQPKVNDIGYQSIMLFVEQAINPQTVQGNRGEEDFGKLMFRFRKSLTRDLWINMHTYDINEREFDGIVDAICIFAEPFLSRTINNKERDSYGQSWVQRDSNTTQAAQKKRFLDYIPFIGGGN